MESATGTAETTPAATSDAPFSLRAYRSGETATAKPAVEAPAPAAAETPDPDVEADPELAAEIDKIEAPKDNETPAEKAARTRKHKEAARKGYQTRLANKASREAQRAEQLARENEDLRRRLTPPAGSAERAAVATPPAKTPVEIHDPADPEPTLETYATAHPEDPDPYAGYLKAWNRWDRRQADREAAAERQQAQQRERVRDISTRVEKHTEHARGVHRDFDDALGKFSNALRGHPADELIAHAVAGIADEKVGGEVLYRLATQVKQTTAAIRGGDAELLRHIGRLEADVLREVAQPAAPAPVITDAAPEPHQPVAAAATGTPRNPASQPGTKLSLREMREWERKHGRRS